MVNNVTNIAHAQSGERYNHVREVNGTAGKEKRDSNIPLQIWQERAGKAMNILQEKVRYRVDPARGGVVMETGSDKDDTGLIFGGAGSLADGAIHPGKSAKGSLINRLG